MKGPQAYAPCGYCGRRLCLRRDGGVRRHRAADVAKGLWPACRGSLIPPAEARALRDLEARAGAGDQDALKTLGAYATRQLIKGGTDRPAEPKE